LMMNDSWILKIADFGYATLLAGKSGNGVLTSFLGTLSYAAPEILNKKPYVGSCADIFSCGVILFVLVTGKLPFGKAVVFDSYYKNFILNNYEGFWNVMSPKIDHVSDEFKSLINNLLAFDATQRPSINEIKNHSWMKSDSPTKDEVFSEFEKRKIIVTQLKELEAQEELKKKTGNRPGGVVYRGEGDTLFEDVKEFFEGKRIVSDFKDGSNPYRVRFCEKDPIVILNYVCRYLNEKDKREKAIETSEEFAKLKICYEGDKEFLKNYPEFEIENLSISIELKKIDDDNHVIEFTKVTGDKFEFMNVYDEFVTYNQSK